MQPRLDSAEGYLLSAKRDEEVKLRFQTLGRMGRFFDASVYQMVRGYENARRVQRLAS